MNSVDLTVRAPLHHVPPVRFYMMMPSSNSEADQLEAHIASYCDNSSSDESFLFGRGRGCYGRSMCRGRGREYPEKEECKAKKSCTYYWY